MDRVVNNIINELYTIQDMVRWVISKFSAANIYFGHGSDNCWDEAIHLVLSSLFLPLNIPQHIWSSRLTLNERRLIIKRTLIRIDKRIPTAYLTNKAWFCGHELYVDERVLIPRSLIGELISKRFVNIINYEPTTILDMCTGSGCIAIACAYEFQEAQIDAVDISLDALTVAEQNINYHGLADRIIPICSDLFLNISYSKYDLIITNPPYADTEDMLNLPKEYLVEPEIALAAGHDGLKFIKRILANASSYLNENGVLICEVGSSMFHLIEQYPNVPFTWLTLKHGGDGIFMLTRKQLIENQKNLNYLSI